jgi:hypothetical protein
MGERIELQDMPARMKGRPFDHRGFPVPWFVTRKTDAGLWDFQVVEATRKDEAIRHRKCWVTGEPLGRAVAFVIGPMCIINRVSSDPPIIPEVAEWSARICPFLSRPLAKRPHFDGNQMDTPGLMVADNPGLCAVWVTRGYAYGRTGLFRLLDDPVRVSWWRNGREVTGTEEAQAIYEARAEKLRQMAADEGSFALQEFERMKRHSDPFSPMGLQP